jgi:site-specific DNA recombinase
VALPDIYDDGGLSGGTLARPALQRLLSAVAADQVDIIVVYKVDRLTRSLMDFSKLVETFDKAGTSFVSVTQSFNTTTSMGRLTLNMLLSFAQFEREVTAERIRDKIAASKANGMWMGGTPPLGYEPDGRSLKIVEAHAGLVRGIFNLYLTMGNVREVAETLEQEGVPTPVRTSLAGKTFGGIVLGRGQIYSLLKCGTYVGEVHHRRNVYPGLHKPIIDRDVWDRVQAQIAANTNGHRSGVRSTNPGLLARKIVDASGGALYSSHATKELLATAIKSVETSAMANRSVLCASLRTRSKPRCGPVSVPSSMTGLHWRPPTGCRCRRRTMPRSPIDAQIAGRSRAMGRE